MPHQIKTVEYGLKNPYSIFALQQGLGKSLCLLETLARVGGKLLVICPAYLMPNWEKEIEKFYPGRFKYCSIKKAKDGTKDILNNDIIITSYDIGMKLEGLFSWCTILGLDEANYVKEMNTKRSQFYHRVIFENSVPRLYLLTGTPIKNRVDEYYSLIALCNYDPRIKESKFLNQFPDMPAFADRYSFRETYDIETKWGYKTICKWSGLKNAEELKSWVRGHYIRFKSEDVLNLPKVIYKEVNIFNKTDLELIQAFEKADIGSSVMPEAKRNAAVFCAEYTIKYVKDLLETEDNVVVYSDHVDSCIKIAERFGVPAITGQMPSSKRFEVAHQFQTGKTRVLCATIKSFSTGIDLTNSRNMVFNDIPWVPGDLEQAIFRIVRLSQKRGCIIHKLFASPQSKQIHDTIIAKTSVINGVI